MAAMPLCLLMGLLAVGRHTPCRSNLKKNAFYFPCIIYNFFFFYACTMCNLVQQFKKKKLGDVFYVAVVLFCNENRHNDCYTCLLRIPSVSNTRMKKSHIGKNFTS